MNFSIYYFTLYVSKAHARIYHYVRSMNNIMQLYDNIKHKNGDAIPLIIGVRFSHNAVCKVFRQFSVVLSEKWYLVREINNNNIVLRFIWL